MGYCGKCGIETDVGVFCEECAVKFAPKPQVSELQQKQLTANPSVKKTHTLTLSSTSKFPGPSDFDIIVDGINQGKIKTGKNLTVSSYEPEIELLIKAWGTNPYKARLRLTQFAYLEIGVWKNNIIFSGLSGADVI
ncbi:MAG: hypothetical protein FWE60_00640 [Oscillospiraceae bacterium]|nr:hypothetical protein [Oscillospiraceae bacterium]